MLQCLQQRLHLWGLNVVPCQVQLLQVGKTTSLQRSHKLLCCFLVQLAVEQAQLLQHCCWRQGLKSLDMDLSGHQKPIVL